MPFKSLNAITKTSFKKGHIRSKQSIEKQRQKMIGKINRLAIERMNTPEANAKKGRKGTDSPLWIKDRTKLKTKRLFTEERWFFKGIIEKRNFKCELTNRGGVLSVHHIKPVWKHKELMFDENNVVVIKLEIHKLFHCLYGNRSTEEDWYNFLREKQYESI